MSIDRRKNERKNFCMDSFNGKFIVTDQTGNNVEILNVNDVSISGIGLQVQEISFDPGEIIKLNYESDGLSIAISAVVRWCSYVSQSEGSRLGLQFEPGQGDMNLLFFMALREHLDAFDHVALSETM